MSMLPSGGQGHGPATATNAWYTDKRLVFIRCGKSTCNASFNAGDRSKAIFVLLFVTYQPYAFMGGKDSRSCFFESPPSAKGIKWDKVLAKFLRKERMRLGSSPEKTREEKAAEGR